MVITPTMQPQEKEPICLVSYKIASILLNGTPEDRPSFWQVYRQEQELNIKTGYDNYHVQICRQFWDEDDLKRTWYFERGQLVDEKGIRHSSD